MSIKTKFIKTIMVTDPDSGGEVEVGLYKLETGGIAGIDASYIEQEVGPVYCPYDHGEELEIDE